MNIQTQEKIISLIEEMIEGASTEESRRELVALITNDTEARKFYISQCQLHAMLSWEHGVLPSVQFDSALPAIKPVSKRNTQSYFPQMALWVCALLGIIAAVGFLFWETRSTLLDIAVITETTSSAPEIHISDWIDREAVGRIIKSHGAKLHCVDGQRSLDPGDVIRLGNYTLASGFVEVFMDVGVNAIIESPASFEIKSKMLIVLDRGVMSAKVSPTGIGFSILTPTANVIDHGTEFAVEVFDDSGSEVHVFEGKVDVQPKMAPPQSSAVRLITDQATRISSVGKIPQGIDIAQDRYVRTLPESGDEPNPYSQFVKSLNPTTYLRMASSSDGRSLADSGSGATPAFLRCDSMASPPFAPGRFGQALRLEGPSATSYALIPQFPRAMTDQITVSAWVRAESRPRWAAIAKHWSIELDEETGEPYGLGGQFHLGLNEDSGDLEVQILDSNKKRIQIKEGIPIPLHQWTHVAFTVDGEMVSLYRNGELVGQAECDGLSVTGLDALGIGAKLSPDGSGPDPSNPGYWHGRIDEFFVLHHSISAEQVRALYKLGQL